MQSSLSAKIIEDKILENYQEYAGLFGELQSDFLSGLYKRYYDLESGHLVLYFVKKAHQSILRKKDFDLSFDLSFDNFWKNHNETKFDPTTIITTSQETNLPKETARRKILELIKQDVLNKKLKTIAWVPSEEYKKNYDQFIATEIIQISKILKFVSHQNNHKISDEEVEIHIKKQFSFFWFHYLNAQLNYIKLCKKKFKDLDVLFISLQLMVLLVSRIKDLKISHANFFKNPKIIKDIYDNHEATISATTIAEVTGLPRTTCIRKLNSMMKSKMITQNKLTKGFCLIPEFFSKNLASEKTNQEVVKIFSEFFFIFLKTVRTKN